MLVISLHPDATKQAPLYAMRTDGYLVIVLHSHALEWNTSVFNVVFQIIHTREVMTMPREQFEELFVRVPALGEE
jgi:hypothetical protein